MLRSRHRASGRLLRRSPRRGGEDGIALVEVMVALFVFVLVLAPLTNSLVTALRVSSNSRQAVVAANLLSQTLDSARSEPFQDLAIATTTSTATLNGVTFSVQQVIQPLAPPEDSTDVCGASTGGTGSDDYLLVSVAVSWPHMTQAPIAGRTMLAPPATIIASGDAEVIVQVFSADQNPAVGVPVSINTNPPESAPIETVTTNNNGCAAFPYLSVGPSYVISATGYTDPNQDAPAQHAIGALTLNETDEVTTGINFDLPTALDGPVQTDCLSGSTYVACSGATTDVVYPTSCMAGTNPCSSQGPIPVVFEPFGDAAARVISGASGPGSADEASTTGYPFFNNYEAFAGTCVDALPTPTYVEGLTSYPGRNALIWPGNPTVTLFAKPISVSTYPVTITVTHGTDADCSNGETYTYTISSAPPNGETLALAVPVGSNWTFQRTSPTVGTAATGVAIPPTSSTALAL
jgi:type II secretory pathway pseudopilin PulG